MANAPRFVLWMDGVATGSTVPSVGRSVAVHVTSAYGCPSRRRDARAHGVARPGRAARSLVELCRDHWSLRRAAPRAPGVREPRPEMRRSSSAYLACWSRSTRTRSRCFDPGVPRASSPPWTNAPAWRSRLGSTVCSSSASTPRSHSWPPRPGSSSSWSTACACVRSSWRGLPVRCGEPRRCAGITYSGGPARIRHRPRAAGAVAG